jgi:hypothetical protein
MQQRRSPLTNLTTPLSLDALEAVSGGALGDLSSFGSSSLEGIDAFPGSDGTPSVGDPFPMLDPLDPTTPFEFPEIDLPPDLGPFDPGIFGGPQLEDAEGFGGGFGGFFDDLGGGFGGDIDGVGGFGGFFDDLGGGFGGDIDGVGGFGGFFDDLGGGFGGAFDGGGFDDFGGGDL